MNEAERLAREWLPVDDGGEDAALRVEPLEGLYFLVRPARAHGAARAEHDQEARTGERILDVFGKVVRGRQFPPIAEDRGQAPRDRTVLGELSDQPPRYAELLQRIMQPVGHFLVGVTVT